MKACELAELTQEELEQLEFQTNGKNYMMTETEGKFLKRDFLDIMEKACYLPRKECSRVFDLIFYLIIKNIYYGKRVVIPNFGSFHTYVQPRRTGHHIAATGEKATLMARAKARFVPSRYTQSILNPVRAEIYKSYQGQSMNFKHKDKMEEYEKELMTDPFQDWH